MPDCVLAREAVWEPFLRDTLRAGPRDVLVGHSSGAAAALRYAEQHKVAGVVVLSTMATDMGLPWEKAAGWFARPWDWAAIKKNSGFVVQVRARACGERSRGGSVCCPV
jgi:pimeloyl-ACP methyl ester carboxylesterase